MTKRRRIRRCAHCFSTALEELPDGSAKCKTCDKVTPSDETMFLNPGVNRTHLGLVSLTIGVLLASMPWIGVFGDLFALVGAFLIAAGREAFWRPHRIVAIPAVALYMVLVITFRFAFTNSMALGNLPESHLGDPALLASALREAFKSLERTVPLAVLLGVAQALVVVALQAGSGRIALGAAVVGTLGVQLLVIDSLRPRFEAAAELLAAGGANPFAVMGGLRADMVNTYLLTIAPAALFAVAFLYAWFRVRRREVLLAA